MNNEYRLQLLNHSEIFPTREEAIEYIEDNFKGAALWSEPAVFFYGTEREPKMILAVGASKSTTRPRICYIDDAELRELIAAVQEQTDENADNIQIAADRILNIISAVGLTLDENKIKDQISYDPSTTDELIGRAKTVAEAIAIISTFVQTKLKGNELTVNDGKSIDFDFNKTENGSTLTAEVKISEEGNDDDLEFNNNIVGLKSDGVFASCNIEYDAERNRLIFTTSGMKNGRFVTDANKKIIDFGTHTIYTADNEDHTVQLTINQETKKISADVKISSDDDNLLVQKDGKMYVSGRAKDIKYKNTTVGAKLNAIDEEIADIFNKIQILTVEDLIEGDESDTILTKAIKKQNGGYTVTADVRLSTDNSIGVANGGLKANVDIDVDSTNNKIVLRVGNNEKAVSLPGISILDNIYYDSANKCIVITWKDGQQQTVIPVGDMLKTWIVENPVSSPIVLTKSESSVAGQPEVLSADIKIAQTDNLIGKDSYGQIYVRKSDIDNKINEEATARQTADNTLQSSINAEATARHTADDELNIAINAAREEAAANLETAKTDIYSRIDADEDKINEAFANAEEAKNLVTLTNANLDAEINRAQTAESTNAAAINDLTSRTTALESGLSLEKSERTTADAVHDERITNLSNGLESAEESHREDIENLSSLIHANTDAIAVLNGSESTVGSVLEAVKGAKTYAEALSANEKERAMEKENLISLSLEEEIGRARDAEAQVLADGKAYTDHSIADAKVLSDIYTDNAKADAIAQSKSYTDTQIADKVEIEKNRAMAAEGANATAIVSLQEKDAQIDTELAKKIEEVSVEKNSANDLQYIIKVDGQSVGTIDIPKDQFLKTVTYDSGNKTIVFTFETSEGTEVVSVSVADLVNTYTAGNGLTLTDNKFSVRINEDSESYLTVTQEGIKISGIDAALAEKANIGDSYTKSESDAKYLTEHQDISGLATKSELQVVDTKATNNADAIAVINGNESQEGSIKKALADANAYTDAEILTEKTRAMAAENANADAITILNGNEAQTGSVKKALADAKAYTDNKIATVNSTHAADMATVNEALANKANKSEVYTKAEIEAKNYLTSTDIANLATKEELSTENIRAVTAETNLQTAINTANENITNNASNISSLQAEAVRLNIIADETNTVKLTKSKDDNGTELAANVKLDATATNIIKVSGNGIYADVEMSYSQATNTITFTNGLTSQEFQLAGASLLEDGYYNSSTRQIILVTRLADGTTKNIVIDADALIHTLKVDNGTQNPIKLAKTTDSDGVDVLSARLDISTEGHNLILNSNGTLYASNEAKNHTALWNGAEKTLQEVLELLKSEAEAGSEAAQEIAQIEAELHEVERDMLSIQSNISTLNTRVSENTTAIATNTGSINTLASQVSDLNGRVTNISNNLNELEEFVNGYETRISTLESDNANNKINIEDLINRVSTMETELGDISGLKTVADRLAELESNINDGDYGTY